MNLLRWRGMTTLASQRRYLLRHTFGGSSLTPSDLGPSLSGGGAVVSGGVLAKDSSADRNYVADLRSNLTAQCKVNFGNSAGTVRRVSLRIRADAGLLNLIEATLSRTDNGLMLWRRDAGVVTALGSLGSLGLADSTDYWVRLSALGSRLETAWSTNGVTFSAPLVVTDASWASQIRFSLELRDNVASPTIQVDDLLAWAA